VALDLPHHEVFVSFASRDRLVADKVAEHLRRDGLRVWRFVDNPGSGSWHLNELRALRDSKVAVFIVTPHSDASPVCLDEAQRAAAPARAGTVPVPLVVGAWDHEASDLWLLLGKWNGVIAGPDLTDEALRRLAGIVHDRLGYRPVASLSTGQALLSTGQALTAVKDDVCAYLEAHPQAAAEEILDKTRELQVQYRGEMVSFAQFTFLDRELLAAGLMEPPQRAAYVTAYLRAFFDQVVAGAHSGAAARLARHLMPGDTIVVSEYSRVLRQAFKAIAETDRRLMRSLRVVIITRTGMLLVDDEPSRMADELAAMGASTRRVHFSDWVDYLTTGADTAGIGRVDKVLFGVEAFSMAGDVVFPQIVKELDALQARRSADDGTWDAQVIAAGESYKVCRDAREVTRMISDPHYTVMPSSFFDVLVTDTGEFRPRDHSHVTMRACVSHVEAAADEIRAALWPGAEPLPVWNAPQRKLAAVKVVAADVDGTVTTGGRIAPSTLAMFERLRDSGRQVVLVTGRSAGRRRGAGPVPAGHLRGDRRERGGADPGRGRRNPARHPGRGHHGRHRPRGSGRRRVPRRRAGPVPGSRARRRRLLPHQRPHPGISPGIDPAAQVVTVGDSVNDELLFEPGAFAATFGVRGVLRAIAGTGMRPPDYVALADGGAGFDEIGALLVRAR
jgi:TIR domain